MGKTCLGIRLIGRDRRVGCNARDWSVAGLLSKFFQVFLLYLGSRKVFTFKVNNVKQFYLPLFYTALCIISFFAFHRHPGILVYLFQLLIIYIAVILVFRKELLQMIEEAKKSRYLAGFRTKSNA